MNQIVDKQTRSLFFYKYHMIKNEKEIKIKMRRNFQYQFI